MSRLSFEQTVAALEARGIMPERAPSLDPMIEGLKRIGFAGGFPFASRTIVVAGTNGKGSVCATLEAIFLERGERVGLYTSPHLVEITERIRVGGADLSRELFCEAYARVDEPTRDMKLTHFEMLTLMAIWVFCSGKAGRVCDRIILEVGLGGIWDATNAVPHLTSVLTAIDYDHQNLLGRTLPEIAANKLGIVRRGTLVVHAPFAPELGPLVAETRARLGGRWVEALPFRLRVDESGEEPRYFIRIEEGEAGLRLAGRRGAENTALALTVARELDVQAADALGALSRVRWGGRMERAGRAPSGAPIYLSGDHNPQGVKSLVELLAHYRRDRLHVVAGVGKDKDGEGVLAPLFGLERCHVYLTETPFRGRALAEYGPWLERAAFAHADPNAALAAALAAATSNDLVLVTGSLYLVGALRARVCRTVDEKNPARREQRAGS